MKKGLSKILALLMAILTLLSAFDAFALTEGSKYNFKDCIQEF